MPVPEKPAWSLKRFFTALEGPVSALPATVTLQDESVAHHLRTVMRAKAGEWVVLVDEPSGTAYRATLEALTRQTLTLALLEALPAPAATLPSVTVAAALIKEQRWDTLLQKCAELGAARFQPLRAERSIIRLTGDEWLKKRERWHAVVRAAAEQSEGCFIPEILPPLTVPEFVQSVESAALKLILKERGADRLPMKAQLARKTGDQPVVLAIGPEGGWTDPEFEAFEHAGFWPVILGNRVLRSETAALAALSAVVYECDGL